MGYVSPGDLRAEDPCTKVPQDTLSSPPALTVMGNSQKTGTTSLQVGDKSFRDLSSECQSQSFIWFNS